MYCERCKILTDNTVCSCGAKNLREPNKNDAVYLTTKDQIFSSMLEDVLGQHGIPCLKQAKLGAAFVRTVGFGTRFEEYRFFVPFEMFDRANELLEELFTDADNVEPVEESKPLPVESKRKLKIWEVVLYIFGVIFIALGSPLIIIAISDSYLPFWTPGIIFTVIGTICAALPMLLRGKPKE